MLSHTCPWGASPCAITFPPSSSAALLSPPASFLGCCCLCFVVVFVASEVTGLHLLRVVGCFSPCGLFRDGPWRLSWLTQGPPSRPFARVTGTLCPGPSSLPRAVCVGAPHFALLFSAWAGPCWGCRLPGGCGAAGASPLFLARCVSYKVWP